MHGPYGFNLGHVPSNNLGVPDHVCFEVGGQHVAVLPAVQEPLPALREGSERRVRGPEQREGSVQRVPEQRQQLRVLQQPAVNPVPQRLGHLRDVLL